MTHQIVKRTLALSMAGVLAMTAPASLYAAETEAAEEVTEKVTEDAVTEEAVTEEANTEADPEAQEAVTEAEEANVKPDDFTLAFEGSEIMVNNEAVEIASAELTEADSYAEDNTAEEGSAETEGDTETAEVVWNLVLTEADGTVHTFENVTPERWTEPSLVSEYEWLYITYQDENGNSRETAEAGSEKEFEEPVSVWVTTDVNIRAEATSDSEALQVSSIGTELQAVGSASGWVKVESGDITGYINHHYLAADQETADAAVQAENNARAAAEAAAAAAAAQAAAQAQSRQKKSSGKTVVSRQAYDDCDGSGHGYYEIIYSDGSVAYEDY